MRFHMGFSFRPKQILAILGAVAAAIAGLIAGGVIK